MPPPTNISFLTARDLGTITTSTQTFTQQIDDAGVNKTTYYTFICPADVTEISVFGRVDISTVAIVSRVYVGPAAAPTLLLDGGPAVAGTDVPIQVPVIAASTYFIECTPGAFVSSPETLSLSVTAALHGAVPAGSFAINDDTVGGFPLVVLSGTADYTALKFLTPFPAGEAGDTLPVGTFCVENEDTSSAVVFNSAYQQFASHTLSSSLSIRTCLGANAFYVATDTNPPHVYKISLDGTIGAAVDLTAMLTCVALAASNDETKFYHADAGANKAIRVWDVGVGAGADLAAAIPNYHVTDILVLGDDSIVVGYNKTTVTRAYQVKRYSAAGATLNTYSGFAEPTAATGARLAYAIDDPVSFWVMNHNAATPGLKTFQNVKVSDGSILSTRNHAVFEGGVYVGGATLTPPANFGASFSCPFWVTRAAQPSTTTFTIRRQRRFLLPSSPDNKNMQIPTIELLLRTGIGLTPDAWGGSTPQGADPQVMTRISKDGGKTWSPERWISAGKIGEYLTRVRILQATGNYRNAVFEVTVSDPVDWQMLSAMGTPIEGSS